MELLFSSGELRPRDNDRAIESMTGLVDSRDATAIKNSAAPSGGAALTNVVRCGYWLPLPPLLPVPVVPLPVPLVFMLPVELFGSVMPVGCVVMPEPLAAGALAP